MRKLILLSILGVAFTACKKEATSWNSDVRAPLLKSNLGIRDLIADSLIEVGDDQTVAFRIEENIFNLGIDSLIDIEPDTVSKTFSIAPLFEFTFNPGQTFYNADETFEFEGIEAQLSHAILKTGSLYLYAENTIESDLDFTLKIPKAIKDGESLLINATIPAATGSNISILEMEIDIADYALDLTGASGNSYNILEVEFTLTNPLENDPITVINTDEVNLSLSYSNLKVAYALGYLGSETIDLDEESSFDLLPEYLESILDLNSVEATLIFKNGFGVDVQALIYQLEVFNSSNNSNVSLQNSLIGSTINLSRAGSTNGHIEPFIKEYSLNNSNSNITHFIEIIPDSVQIAGNTNLNPFGNISNYNDFLSSNSSLSCDVSLKIPLQLSLTNLVINDTKPIQWPGNENFSVVSGSLYLRAENSFPAQLFLQLIALDEFNNSILNLNSYLSDSDGTISGNADHLPVRSLLKYNLDAPAIEIMKQADKIAIKAHFETAAYPQEVVFNSTDSLKLLLSTDFNSNFSY